MSGSLSPLQISAEFFPPKTEAAEAALRETVKAVSGIAPEFVSVTYGAGGSSQDKTLKTLKDIAENYDFPVAGHLTCVGRSKSEVNEVAEFYREIGVNKIVALRGDAQNGAAFAPHPDGYQNAADLIGGLAKIGGFELIAACYPEKHPESPTFEADIDNFKRKQDAGASSAITQFFFENADFFRFVEQAEKAGITIPIVPGILPITHFKNAKSFAERCGSKVPDALGEYFKDLDDSDNAAVRHAIAAHLCASQCVDLLKQGVNHFHFYTLNKSDLTLAVTRILSVTAQNG